VNRKKLSTRVSIVFLVLVTCASLAQAQATRTWVSGVGDDVNPCSRTAPCKTFAGAISKTAAGGEISVLDPGGFGTVTITKAITINGTGVVASITAAATTGIIVNAGANDVVIIRNISINGVGTGTNGIRFLAGGALHVQGVDINGFNASPGLGLDVTTTTVSRLFVDDTTFRNNGVFASSLGGGIRIAPGVGGAVGAVMRNVTVDRNVTGIRVNSNASLFMRDSIIGGNLLNGFFAESTGAGAVNGFLDHVSVFANQGAGIVSSGSNALVRITDVSLSGNFTGGLSALSSGQILSFGTNKNAGNGGGVDGAPTGVVIPQQ
jgi:hypothetical protein